MFKRVLPIIFSSLLIFSTSAGFANGLYVTVDDCLLRTPRYLQEQFGLGRLSVRFEVGNGPEAIRISDFELVEKGGKVSAHLGENGFVETWLRVTWPPELVRFGFPGDNPGAHFFFEDADNYFWEVEEVAESNTLREFWADYPDIVGHQPPMVGLPVLHRGWLGLRCTSEGFYPINSLSLPAQTPPSSEMLVEPPIGTEVGRNLVPYSLVTQPRLTFDEVINMIQDHSFIELNEWAKHAYLVYIHEGLNAFGAHFRWEIGLGYVATGFTRTGRTGATPIRAYLLEADYDNIYIEWKVRYRKVLDAVNNRMKVDQKTD